MANYKGKNFFSVMKGVLKPPEPPPIGVSTQGHSRAMPYQTESEEKLLLSEELILSLKRFELPGCYYCYFTLFLSIIVLFTSKPINCSILY